MAIFDFQTPSGMLQTMKTLAWIHTLQGRGSYAPPAEILPGPWDSFGSKPQVGTCSPFCWVLRGDDLALLLGGMRTATQAAGFLATAGLPAVKLYTFHVNRMIAGDAGTVAKYLISLAAGRPLRLQVAGYSYGGAITFPVIGLLKVGSPFTSLEAFTAGSPRPGSADLGEWIADIPTKRIFCDTDPIPRFPPHVDEAPSFSVTLPLAALYNYNAYLQPVPGIELGSDGSLLGRSGPSKKRIIVDANLLTWLTGVDGLVSDGHSTKTYVQRLALAVQAGRTPAAGSSPIGEREEQPQEIAAALAQATVRLEQQAAENVVERSQMAAYIPPFYRPEVQHVKGGYVVLWLGSIIASCPTRSHAKTIRKYLFKYLRVLGFDTTVFATTFSQQWMEFTSAAATTGNNFNPTWVVK